MSPARPKVLIIDQMHESIVPLLEEKGFAASYRPDTLAVEVPQILEPFEVLLLRSKLPITEELLAHAPNLKVIGRAGAGLDQIDLQAVERRGIALLHAAEGNRDAVAEHAMGMLLCLLNKLHIADRQVRKSQWLREANRGWELAGKTVGIIGLGCMGQAFARRLAGFGCRVLAYDTSHKGVGLPGVEEVSLPELQAQADVVSLHIPLTEANRCLINQEYLEGFRKNIVLINTSRGEVLPLADLVAALKSGKVWAAALDVLENEKVQQLSPAQQANFDYLITSDRVLLSPHVAGWTYESYEKINQVLVQKLARVLAPTGL
ncbi:NAD(P)-dependent oxidoreductase [Cesiribacter andamanensis]|uniref:D-lactate dehydrogenase n=1 Tax=Cesiribacter andamanensis AMV16 TaxID=1279009 RepID=M7N607_9BACT|nr:NAD(P)-dependent oxidoreductase [Cesiribacter andamanensis]EMR02712.1 D-lactate dehydrogenase [Cesiribacter andamanensis AMV16]